MLKAFFVFTRSIHPASWRHNNCGRWKIFPNINCSVVKPPTKHTRDKFVYNNEKESPTEDWIDESKGVTSLTQKGEGKGLRWSG
jgi:hypothetical protein